ncbi:MAG: NAD(P)H-dependent oxidoreductase [Candidatus Nanoarchaeia archaeon]
MKFDEIVKQRYATKKFDGKSIPKEQIEHLKDMIRFSASSYNVQPWKVKIVVDSKIKEKLLVASYNQPQITTCSHLLVFCADTNLLDKTKKLANTMRLEKVPEETIKTYMDMVNGFVSSMSDKDKLVWAQKQTYLALGNALNGAKALGFDSCPMEGFNAEEYSKILKLPVNLVPTIVCPVGFAAKEDPQRPKLRFSKEDMFF